MRTVVPVPVTMDQELSHAAVLQDTLVMPAPQALRQVIDFFTNRITT